MLALRITKEFYAYRSNRLTICGSFPSDIPANHLLSSGVARAGSLIMDGMSSFSAPSL